MFTSQPVKPNKYSACEQVYTDYYECVLVKEANFGKFIGRCNKVKELLDACNIEQQKLARQKNFELSKLRNQIISERTKEVQEAKEARMGSSATSKGTKS